MHQDEVRSSKETTEVIDVIYCLADLDNNPFYVGRTNSPDRRLCEHRRNAKCIANSEMKYQHIRKLWKEGKEFQMIIIDENPGEKYEKYYHYQLGLDHDLTNMKMGDAAKTEQTAFKLMREVGAEYTPETFCSELKAVVDLIEAEAAAKLKAARVNAKIRANERGSVERTLFVGEKPEERFMSRWMLDRLDKKRKK